MKFFPIALLCGLVPLYCVDAVTVVNGFGDDPAVAFAVKDLESQLKQVPGGIRLKRDASLKTQQWRAKTAPDGTLEISGRDGMGVVYGVYGFLERFAAARWYAPDTVRKSDMKTLPKLDFTFRPAVLRREMYADMPLPSEWRLRNRETMRASYGVNIRNGSPRASHTFAAYAEAVEDPSLHGVAPNGKVSPRVLCLTKPEVRKIVAEKMCGYIEADRRKNAGRPDYAFPSIYELSQDDGGHCGCCCAGCKALMKREGSWAGPNIDFVNAVASEVGKRYPDVTVRTFAYSYTERPPKTVRAAENVSIRFCRSFLFAPLVKDSFNGNMLEEWNDHAGDKEVWGYWRMYSGPLFPVVKPRKDIGDEMRFCAENGVNGYFAEAENPIYRSFSALQHWLFLKLAEDPSGDVFALADEFMGAYYGAAAPSMKRYLAYLEERLAEMLPKLDAKFLENTGSGDLAMFTVQDWLDRGFFEKANVWLDEAERLAAGNPLALRHVRAERLIVDRSMFGCLSSLREAGYRCDVKKTLARFRASGNDVFGNPLLPGKYRKELLERHEMECESFGKMPHPIPERFAGKDVLEYDYLALQGFRRSSEIVRDDDAVAGYAMRIRNAGKTKFPYSFGMYSDITRKGQGTKVEESSVESPARYKLYKLGEDVILNPYYIYFDRTWRSRLWLPTIGVPPEKREVWLSAKISRDEVLFERLFLVGPAKRKKAPAAVPKKKEIVCQEIFPAHCQGVATDGEYIYWSFTVALVKTDMEGKVLARHEVPGVHMGDLCCRGGKVYVGMNMRENRDRTRVGDEVWIYDAETLKREKIVKTPETVWCNNGLEWYNGSFWVVGNAPKGFPYNFVFEYTEDFRFKRMCPIASGWTNLGVQTICFAKGLMWFGTYGGKKPDGSPMSVFAVDPKALTAPGSSESPPIVPVKRMVNCYVAEGLLEMDGVIWREIGIRHKPLEPGGRFRWSGKLVPTSL